MKITLSIFSLLALYLVSWFVEPPTMVNINQLMASSEEHLSARDKRSYEHADELFQSEHFKEALVVYKELMEKYPDDIYFKYRTGICYLYKGDERHKAVTLLEEVEAGAPDFLEVKFYLGRAYHYQLRFQEAIDKMSQFSHTEGVEYPDQQVIDRYIQYCHDGKEIIKKETDWKVKNLGDKVNTSASEYVPLLSPDEDLLYFTYKGENSVGGLQNEKFKKASKRDIKLKKAEYSEDVYLSEKVNGEWTEPEVINNLINTNHHEASLAVSIDGQRLFIYKSDKKTGNDIYMSHFDGEDWPEPTRLEGGVNSDDWEGSATLSADGRTLYFASDREGGYGARDLYTANLLPDGTWGNVKNMGPAINTEDDEDSPFIHADGITLYFSSNGHETMGDNDIFFTKNEEYGWTIPENMGYPISTPADDRYFVMSIDKRRGYFSSEMDGTLGEHDIYMVYRDIVDEPNTLAYIKGQVMLDEQPTYSQVKVSIMGESEDEEYADYESNAATGKLRMVLNKDLMYKLEISVPERTDVEPIEQIFATNNIEEMLTVTHTFHLYSKEYEELVGSEGMMDSTLEQAIDKAIQIQKGTWVEPEIVAEVIEEPENSSDKSNASSENEVANVGPCGAPLFIDFSAFVGADLNDSIIYQNFVSTAGDYCLEGLEFRVQVGAYKFPLNFKYPHLRQFGTAEVIDYPDKLSRFTMGTFNTITKAEKQRQRIIKAGQFDAWITPFYNGKRHLMHELIEVNFYGKQIN